MKKKKLLWDLFFTFAKIGLFTFGGGYAMLSLIEHQCVEIKKWITHENLSTITAIAESTPGPISINCATYTGYIQAGISGSVAATLGIVLPSFFILYFISLFFDHFLEIPLIASAFKGIKIGVSILIAQAAITMFKKMKKKPQTVLIFVLALTATLLLELFSVHFSTIYLLAAAGILGLLLDFVNRHCQKGGK